MRKAENHKKKVWPWGIAFVILMLIVGYFAGIAIDKARAATPVSQQVAQRVLTCGEGCSNSRVRNRHEGVRKFHRGAVDRQKRGIGYSHAQKRKIKNAIYRAYRRQTSRSAVPLLARQQITARGGSTKSYLWKRFKAVDSCGYRPHRSGSGSWARWTCQTPAPVIQNQLSGNEIRGLVCWTAAGAAVPAVVMSAGTGAILAWGLVGIGGGASACTWGPMLERMGR